MDKPIQAPAGGDQDKSGGILATSILALSSTMIFIILRFITRIFLVKKLWWDDYCIIFAGLGHCVGMGLIVPGLSYGFGRPAYYLTDHQLQEFMKYGYGEWLQTFATLTFTKLSICLLLLRIAISKTFRVPLWTAIGILIVSNIILSILWILQCRPHLDKAWNKNMPGKCFSDDQLKHIILAQAIISILSDFFLSAFPILILRKVQISYRTKVALCLLMGLGVITGSLSIVRTVLNWQNVTNDPTWLVIPNWYWRTWEVLFGVVAACAPTLRPLYKLCVAKVSGYGKSSNYKTTTGKETLLKQSKPPGGEKSDIKETTAQTTTERSATLPIQKFDEAALFAELGEKEGTVQHVEYPPDAHTEVNPSMARPLPSRRWDTEERLAGK